MKDYKYKKVDGYEDPNIFLEVVRRMSCLGKDHLNDRSDVEIISSKAFIDRGSPIYVVDESVIDAMKDTTISDEIKYEDIKLPLRSCAFFLPNKEVILYSVIDGFEKLRNGEVIGTSDFGKWFLSFYMQSFGQPVLTSKYKMESAITYSINGGDDVTEDENEKTIQRRIDCWKLIMLLNCRPDMVDGGEILRTIKKGKIELKSLRTISFQRHANSEDRGGSHRSPSIHIRKGHFRKQPVGPRDKSDFKIIWLEPMMIGVAS